MTKQELIDYISARDFAVIATRGGTFPESACIQFGNDGLTLIFDTLKTSRKFKNIQKHPEVSLVIGWEDERTVQYEGIATLLSGDELEKLKQVYFAKSEYAEQWQKEGTVYFKVEPVWVRYSDLNTDPHTIEEFDMNAVATAVRYFELSNDSDFLGIADLFTDQTIYTSQNTGQYIGRDSIINMQKPFHAGFKEKRWEINGKPKEIKPGVVLIDYTFTGTKTNNEKVESGGLEYITVDSGRIVRVEIKNKD